MYVKSREWNGRKEGNVVPWGRIGWIRCVVRAKNEKGVWKKTLIERWKKEEEEEEEEEEEVEH